MCMTTCIPGSCVSQKRASAPLKVGSAVAVNHLVGAGSHASLMSFARTANAVNHGAISPTQERNYFCFVFLQNVFIYKLCSYISGQPLIRNYPYAIHLGHYFQFLMAITTLWDCKSSTGHGCPFHVVWFLFCMKETKGVKKKGRLCSPPFPV